MQDFENRVREKLWSMRCLLPSPTKEEGSRTCVDFYIPPILTLRTKILGETRPRVILQVSF